MIGAKQRLFYGITEDMADKSLALLDAGRILRRDVDDVVVGIHLTGTAAHQRHRNDSAVPAGR